MRPNARANRRWRLTLRRFGALVAAASVVAGILLAGVVVVSLALARGCGTSSAPDVPMSASRLAATALAGHPVASASAGPDLVFVSLRGWRSGDRSGIEVLRRHRGGLRSTAVISMRSQPAGLATSPNGRLLLAALDEGVAVLDVARAATGDPSALLGTVPTGRGAGTAQVAVAGRYVFTADETAGRVTVLDLPRLEAGDFGPGAQVAAVEVDMAPAGLSGSPDGRYMYVVSQVERPVVSLAPSDFLYSLMTSVGVPRRSGILGVIDIGRIERNAASAIIA